MLIYTQKHNRIFAKIISIALIHAFFFTGILYQDSINSSDNKNIVSIYMIESALRVPMANSKENKKDFAGKFFKKPSQALEIEEYIFTVPVNFSVRCDRKGAEHYEAENMSLVRFSDIFPEEKNKVLSMLKEWSDLDCRASRKESRPKSKFGLWKTLPGYWQKSEELLPAYLIFDKNGRLVGTVDCIQVNVVIINKNTEGLLFPVKGICLNEIVVDPRLREGKYSGSKVAYPDLEKYIFLLILKEAVNRKLPFNIGTYSNLSQKNKGVEDLLKHYKVGYKNNNPDYIEISAEQARKFYYKVKVAEQARKFYYKVKVRLADLLASRKKRGPNDI
jgi:hypothetical protein